MSSTSVQLGAAALSGPLVWGLLAYLWKRLRRDPKAEAEARKLNAEADNTIESRLWREITRLDRELGEVRTELANVKRESADEKSGLERENKILRTQVGRLRKRVEGLEKILKVEVKITPEMQRLLDELPDDTDDAER